MTFLSKFLQRFVVVALLVVWFSPAVSAAVPVRSAPLPTFATAPISPVSETRTSQIPNATTSETRSYAEREKQATELEQFQGGFYLYIGGGALLLLIIILLLVL
jgi:hypothetical protein